MVETGKAWPAGTILLSLWLMPLNCNHFGVTGYMLLGIFRYRNPKPAWSVFREASFGHGELKMVNSTHAHWTWHRNDDEEPVRTDEVWINSLAGSGCIQDSSREFRKILMSP